LLRPPLRRFTVITAALYHNATIKAHQELREGTKGDVTTAHRKRSEKKTLNPEKEPKINPKNRITTDVWLFLLSENRRFRFLR
jgi:hypothetical protein